ncbi:MAG: hypothetical protein L0215_02045 [Gemmataceae bacterium]|nr:hypothetical protein [Gemmataceae bacterium]
MHTGRRDHVEAKAQVRRDHGKLHVLANAVWGAADGYETTEQALAAWNQPFWEQPVRQWRHMMHSGPCPVFQSLRMTLFGVLRLVSAFGF